MKCIGRNDQGEPVAFEWDGEKLHEEPIQEHYLRLVEDIYNDRKPDSADLGKVLEDYGVPVEIISYIWTLHRRKIDGVRPPDNIIVASRKKAEVLQAYDDIQQKNMSLNKGEIIKRTASRLGRSVSYVENHLKS